MTATASLTVPHSINPIFQYIFDSFYFNSMNGNFDFVCQSLNCLWMVRVTFIISGSPQKMVQRRQITAPRLPIDKRISADYSIFKNVRQKDGLLGWLCIKWPRPIETKCRPCHHLQFLETKLR